MQHPRYVDRQGSGNCSSSQARSRYEAIPGTARCGSALPPGSECWAAVAFHLQPCGPGMIGLLPERGLFRVSTGWTRPVASHYRWACHTHPNKSRGWCAVLRLAQQDQEGPVGGVFGDPTTAPTSPSSPGPGCSPCPGPGRGSPDDPSLAEYWLSVVRQTPNPRRWTHTPEAAQTQETAVRHAGTADRRRAGTTVPTGVGAVVASPPAARCAATRWSNGSEAPDGGRTATGSSMLWPPAPSRTDGKTSDQPQQHRPKMPLRLA